MRIDDCYRLLELDPAASADELRRAHRDLTKVWHPDRFGHDAPLRERAEEKLKAINEAYEAICRSRGTGAGEVRTGRAPAGGEPVARDGPTVRGGPEKWRDFTRAILAAGAAVFLLLRRPTPLGLVIAAGLLGLSLYFAGRMRSAGRDEPPSGP